MKRGLVVLLLGCGGSTPVRFFGSDGALLRECTQVEEATTPDARRLGLSGRAPLTPREVLVLRYPVVDEACITNGSVGFAITATFVDADGGVVGTERFAANESAARCHRGVLDVYETDVTLADGVTRVSSSRRP